MAYNAHVKICALFSANVLKPHKKKGVGGPGEGGRRVLSSDTSEVSHVNVDESMLC